MSNPTGRQVQFLSILNEIPLAIIVTDLDARIRVFNKAAADLFRIIPICVDGSSFSEIFDAELATNLQRICKQALQSHQKQDLRVRLHQHNRPRSTNVVTSPLRDSDGKLAGVILTCEPSTGKATPALEKFNEIKSEFFRSIADELLMPLAAIHSFAEILNADGTLDECRRNEYVQIILNQSRRLTELLSNIMNLYKIEAGTTDWKIGSHRASEFILLAIDTIKTQPGHGEVEIAYERPREDPVIVADMEKLIQVLSHLISNAIRFSPEGKKITVTQETLKGRRQRDTADFVKIGVHDQGQGINREHFEVIFNKFHKLPDDRRNGNRGTGLGLAISKEIVKQLGGNIWVSSELGKGSSFYFTVPISKDIEQSPEVVYDNTPGISTME